MSRFSFLACLLLVCGCAPAQDIQQTAEKLMRAQPSWLFDGPHDVCPAEVMGAEQVPVRYLGEVCLNDPTKCIEGCKSGVGNDCFSLALAVEPIRGYTPLADRLFLRACSLGVVPACSNRAASMRAEEAPCQVRTYEKACHRSDPWACLTLGMYLARGIGVERNLARARRLITESCELVDDSEWCAYGMDMLMEVDRMERKQREGALTPEPRNDTLLRR